MSHPPTVLCVVHPSPEVREDVLAVLPSCTPSTSAATPAALPPAPDGAAVVVLLDPTLTAPADVVAAFPARPTVVSISELRLPLSDLGVDHVLPRSRLTERAVLQLLLRLGLRPDPCGAAS